MSACFDSSPESFCQSEGCPNSHCVLQQQVEDLKCALPVFGCRMLGLHSATTTSKVIRRHTPITAGGMVLVDRARFELASAERKSASPRFSAMFHYTTGPESN